MQREISRVIPFMNVMIVEENTVMREKIAGLLSRIEGIDAVCQLSTFGKLDRAVEGMKPDIILLDAGIVCREWEKIFELQRINKGMRFIALTENDKNLFERGNAASEIKFDVVMNKWDVFDRMKGFIEGLRDG